MNFSWRDRDVSLHNIFVLLQVVSADMVDIRFEFSPVYWTHNFTLLPTTTTTASPSTSSSSTTTSTTPAAGRKEVQPAYPQPLDEMGNDIGADQDSESATEDKYTLLNNRIEDQKLHSSASVMILSSQNISPIFAICLLIFLRKVLTEQ